MDAEHTAHLATLGDEFECALAREAVDVEGCERVAIPGRDRGASAIIEKISSRTAGVARVAR